MGPAEEAHARSDMTLPAEAAAHEELHLSKAVKPPGRDSAGHIAKGDDRAPERKTDLATVSVPGQDKIDRIADRESRVGAVAKKKTWLRQTVGEASEVAWLCPSRYVDA